MGCQLRLPKYTGSSIPRCTRTSVTAALADRFTSLIGDPPPKDLQLSSTPSGRGGGTPRPRVTFSRNGRTSAGFSGPPNDSQSRPSPVDVAPGTGSGTT